MKLWNRNFILLMQGAFVSTLGDALYSFAIGYYVYQLTGSEAMLGLFSSISMLAIMVLGPVAGAFADRISRKGLIVWMDALRGVVMLVIGGFCIAGRLSIDLLMALTLIIAVSGAFFGPAYSSVTVDLVPHAELARARSVESSLSMVVKVSSRAVGGVLVATIGVGALILFNGVSFLLSALSEQFIHLPASPKQAEGRRLSPAMLLHDLRQGFLAVLHTRGLNTTFFLLLAVNLLCSGVYSLMLVLTTEKGFTIIQYGLLMMLFSIGGLAGSLLMSLFSFSGRCRLWLAFWGFVLMFPLTIVALHTRSFWLMSVLMLLAMAGNSVGNIVTNTGLTLLIPKASRSTILGVVMASTMGGSALSNILYGLLAEWFSLSVVGTVGLLLAVVPTVLLFASSEVRRSITGEMLPERKNTT